MAKPIYTAKNLVKAIDFQYRAHVVIATNEFFGKEGTPVTMYVVKESFYDGHTWVDEELFRSTSAIYVLLFCRDLLFALQGKEIPPPEPEGYARVFEKRQAMSRIQYMVNIYANNSLEAEPAIT